MVTNKGVYNIKNRCEIQRAISLDKIKGVTIGTQDGNDQFIIHVNDEYDYLFRSKDKRQEIINAVKYAYFRAKTSNLPVYGIPDKLTDKHMTSKKQI